MYSTMSAAIRCFRMMLTGHQFFPRSRWSPMLVLGFHSVERALTALDIKDKSQAYKVQKQRVEQFRRHLQATIYIDDWRRKGRGAKQSKSGGDESKSSDRLRRRRDIEFGGESGIRTRVTVSRKHTFQACAFNHSATSPHRFAPAGYAGQVGGSEPRAGIPVLCGRNVAAFNHRPRSLRLPPGKAVAEAGLI